MLIATVSGLSSALLWGVADWLTPRSKHKISFWQINLVVNLAGVFCYAVLFVLTLPHQLPQTDVIIKTIIGSAFLTSGYLFFVKALTIGSVGVVVPLSSIYPVVTLILSIIFLDEVFSGRQIFAMIIIILGAVLLAYERNHQNLPLRTLHRANYLTMVAVLIWGVAFFILNPLINKNNWQYLLLILDVVGLIISFVLMAAVYKTQFISETKRAVANRNAWHAGSLLVAGTAALYWGAAQISNIIIPVVISSVSPLIATALEWQIDKKQLSLIKYAGAIIAVAGIILINL